MGTSLVLALGLYFSGVVAARVLELFAPLQSRQMDVIKPSISWAVFTAYMLNWAPLSTKLLALPQIVALFFTFQMRDNWVVRRYIVFPAIASVLSFVVISRLGPFRNVTSAAAIAIVLAQVISMAQEGVRRMVFPAPLVAPFAQVDAARTRLLTDSNNRRVTIPSSALRGAPAIDGVLLLHPQVVDATKLKKWIVYMGGNGELYEHSAQTGLEYGKRLNANVALYNCRGVGDSLGSIRRATDLVSDGADVVRYLIKEYDLQESNIVLFGHSIGGGVAAQIAAQHFPGCNVVLDRTFSSLSDAARGIMPQLPVSLVRTGVNVLFGDLDSAAVVARLKSKLVTFHREDQIIKYPVASLGRLSSVTVDPNCLLEFTGRFNDPHNIPTTFFPESSKLLSWMDDVLIRAREATPAVPPRRSAL